MFFNQNRFCRVFKLLFLVLMRLHCLKNDTALACYNFDIHQLILIRFGRNLTDKTDSQIMIYFPLPK